MGRATRLAPALAPDVVQRWPAGHGSRGSKVVGPYVAHQGLPRRHGWRFPRCCRRSASSTSC